MPYKLIKVAKTFNVGLHTIVEHLHSQGFTSIEEKPNADVSDEMYAALQKEFQKELAIKQEADKLLRTPPVKKETPAPAPAPPPAPPPKEPSEPAASRPQVVAQPPLREEGQAPANAEETSAKREPLSRAPGLKVLGKIDLNPPKPAPKPEVKPAPEPEKPSAEESQPKEPARPDAKPAPEKPAVAEQAPPPPPPQAKPAPPPAPPVKPEPPAPSAEPEIYRADSPQLRGLKVLGRINLEEPKKQDSRGGRRDDRNKRGGNQQQTGKPAGGTTPQTQNPQDRKPGTGTPAANAGSASEAEKRRRKRKKVQQPVTADSLQKSMSGNQGDKRGTGRRDEPQAVSQKEIEDKIRQTMARMGAGSSRKRQKLRRDKRDTMREKAEQEQARLESGNKLQVTEFISVSDLASIMDIKPADVIKACMSLGVFVSINQRLDAEIIELVGTEFGYEVEFISAEEQVSVEEEVVDDPGDLRERQPIVTVMGHVDHGKTSLLDFIRSAKVAEGEAGGITQHIGAYEVVNEDGRKITFLDTPGHEAFTAMRARGAKVTDIAIIVIAADDNIMPQTKEAISHAQAAGVPIVFAINKIDKPGADPERIKGELAQMNFLVEDWGGKYQSQDISAKTGLNVDKLLEKVLLEADILELKANPARRAVGTVLEASLDKGRGYVTKMLVENGTLHEGDPIISGEFSGRVKAMFNERGGKINEAGPATPVSLLGFEGAPNAGDRFNVMEDEREARNIALKRQQLQREQSVRTKKHLTIEEIGRRIALGDFKELNLIVKGDVDGSVEALTDSLQKLSTEKIQVRIIHKGVG
ncbi:MAG: translation initiation factor IF-2, partial [Saprospiraceae bacterium]|nr:translation initiation factor IF-2 [Saprospiraceae bacterium]